MGYPRRLLGRDEEVLEELRPHARALLPALLWAMLLAALAGAAVAALEGGYERAALIAAPALWVVVAGRSVLRWWCTRYVLTTDRVIVRQGVLARSGTEVPLTSIVDLRFSQRLTGRLLGYGDVLVESAAGEGSHRLADVPDPREVHAEIARARELRVLGVDRPGRGGVVAGLERLADLRERGHLSDEEFERGKRRLLDHD